MRFFESDRRLSTGGLTSGIDATLHLIAERDGAAVAERTRQALGIPVSRYVDAPRMTPLTFGAEDAVFVVISVFYWPKRRAGVWLSRGVDELALAAVLDVYAASFTDVITTIASSDSVVSRHGLGLVPRATARELTTLPAKGRRRRRGGRCASRRCSSASEAPRSHARCCSTASREQGSGRFAHRLHLDVLARREALVARIDHDPPFGL